MTTKYPRVAVVTRTRNRPLTLVRAIRSVLHQTFQDWVHVIINDGGDANTLEAVVAPYQRDYRGRVMIIHNERTMGMQNSSNLGIQKSQSEFITIHDDDDRWHPSFLAKLVEFMSHCGPESLFQGVVCQTTWVFEEIDHHGRLQEVSSCDFMPFEHVSLFDAASDNPFPPIAFLYRRKAHDKVGYFDQGVDVIGDWDFNLRFLMHYEIGVLREKLAYYHWRHRCEKHDPYANTVTAGQSLHHQLARQLRNHLLRADLDKGQIGLGFLLNVSLPMKRLQQSVERLENASRSRDEQMAAHLRLLQEDHSHFRRITRDLERIWEAKAAVAKGVSVVRDLVAKKSAPAACPPVQSKRNTDVSLENVKCLSLDIFDTLLLRKVKRPTDVFLHMEGRVRRILGNESLMFQPVREAAELFARQRKMERENSTEVTLREIYSSLLDIIGRGHEKLDELLETELAAEKSLCFANEGILRLMARAREKGIRIFLTTDMYLNREEIRSLLAPVVPRDIDILVSCEEGVTKHDGALFDRLVAKSGFAPHEILHIGDNPLSDVSKPALKGIRAHHWISSDDARPFVDQLTAYSGDWANDLMSSLYTGFARKRRLQAHYAPNGSADDVWTRLGYEVVGPLYLSFVLWIACRARDLGVKKLFFLSRDGYHLEPLFRKVAEKFHIAIESKYMWASRRLCYLPAINEMDETAIRQLLTANPCMKAPHFISRLGLDWSMFKDEMKEAGIQDFDAEVTSPVGNFVSPDIEARLRRLMIRIQDVILQSAREEKARFSEYMADIGLTPGPIAVVDLGWQASSLMALQKLLRERQPDFKLRGLFFGTWKFAQPAIDEGCEIDSFFIHLAEPAYRGGLVAECVELLETLFMAPHPTVVGIAKSDGSWVPEYGEDELDSSLKQQIGKAQDNALQFCNDALSAVDEFPCAAPIGLGYLETVMSRLWRNPTREEASALGGISLRNSFGGSGPIRYLARIPERHSWGEEGKALVEAYERCFWKKGFEKQLDDKGLKMCGRS